MSTNMSVRRSAGKTALLLTLLVSAAPLLARNAGELHAQTQDGNAVIGRSARIYRSLTSLRADFVQLIKSPMLDSVTTRGTLVQAGEAKFAMRFSDPPNDAIVVDGEHIWIYAPSTTPGQVMRKPVSSGPAYGLNILAWLLDRPSERYKITWLRADRIGDHTTDVVELVPAVPDLPFTRAVVWLDRGDGLPRRIEVQDDNGKRTLTLSKLQTNVRIPPKAFELDLPPNTRIVDK